MGESDGSWGLLARDDDLGEAWDGFDRLPAPGVNAAFDAFLARKHITDASLVRMGARLAAPSVIAFAFPGGIKFRDLVTDRRWSYVGSEFKAMKIVRAQV